MKIERGGSLTVEQVGYHPSGDGANPILPLHFSPCTLKDVADFVKTHHYSHSHPGGIDYAFRLDMDGKLAGACLFGHVAGNPKAAKVLIGDHDVKDFRELMRLVLLDEVPKNTETRFVAWCLRWLRKNTAIKAIVSFADPKYGHVGTIYKAGNWLYTGLQKQDRDRIFVDGVERHPKSLFNAYGTSSLPKLKAMSIGEITTSAREPKHRYVYILRTELKPQVKYEEKDWSYKQTNFDDIFGATQ